MWTLILVVIGVSFNNAAYRTDGTAITQIPGYQTQAECLAAAGSFKNDNNAGTFWRAQCVKAPS